MYNTAKSLVLWLGNDYHVVIPVKAAEALEQFEDFEPYTSEHIQVSLQRNFCSYLEIFVIEQI
jgi:hypothetical protein